ncbi:Recombination, repair and ssDNA binding protein UvsY [uncultured Caudovirales phage]|uniref:Recombination, repair and ssDNA binding protein UvsY n=1 Tax=uncultured Caudovirales phage TaxID=2100421 RepID=A0A6J7WTJ8_9CAUD|nr:Recombination, repair and ssDNA binding protein UvsY [uncultured Caudovirales phage]
MTLDEIHNSWGEDSELSLLKLETSISDVPKLHSKYLRLLTTEKMILRKNEEQRKQLIKLKHDYFLGILSEDELKFNGWEPCRLKILKSDMPMHIEADVDVINMNLKIAVQQEKVFVLEQIIKHISNRGFLIKSMIDWQRFTMGA